MPGISAPCRGLVCRQGRLGNATLRGPGACTWNRVQRTGRAQAQMLLPEQVEGAERTCGGMEGEPPNSRTGQLREGGRGRGRGEAALLFGAASATVKNGGPGVSQVTGQMSYKVP